MHPVNTVGDCMCGQALRGHCASSGQPKGVCMHIAASRGEGSMHRRGHPWVGGSVYRRGHRGALHAGCGAKSRRGHTQAAAVR